MPLSPWFSLYGRRKKPSRRKLAQRIDALKLACQQCHVLPDPQRHKASEWPAVVARMEKNMEWMNRVIGNQRDAREPQLRVEEINAFLIRYARKN